MNKTIVNNPHNDSGKALPLLVTKLSFFIGLLLLIVGFSGVVYWNGKVGKDFSAIHDAGSFFYLSIIGVILMLFSLCYYLLSPALKEESHHLRMDIYRARYKYLLILPGILAVFLFSYLPMYGIILAFKNFKANLGILGSPWVGMQNFARFFGKSISGEVIRNTLEIGFMQLLTGFPVPILLALLLNELGSNKFRRSIQSVLYLPHFISWVIMYSLLYSMFSVTSGIINKIIISLGGDAFNLISDPNKFRPLLYISNIWKEAGWGTIIYMAAIAGIDQEMYEAAHLDGANRFQKIVHITLPSIMFAVTTLLILNVGSILGSNFDQIMNLRTVATENVSTVIDTYVFDIGISKGQFGLSSAIGLFQQAVNCVLLFTANYVVKRITGEGFF